MKPFVRRWLRRGVAAALVLVIALTALHLSLTVIWGRELRATLADIAARGLPTRVEQIVPPPVAAEDDATPAYFVAFAELYDGFAGEQEWIRPSRGKLRAEFRSGNDLAIPAEEDPSRWTPEQRGTVLSAFESSAQARLWQALAEATDRPYCRFPIRYERGPGALLPHISSMKLAQGLMLQYAVLLSTAERDGEAFAWTRRALRLARHVSDDGFLLDRLVAIGLESRALAVLQGLIAAPLRPAADEPLAALAGVLAERSFIKDFQRTLDIERVDCGERIFSAFAAGDSAASIWGIRPTLAMRLYASPLGYPLQVKNHLEYERHQIALRDLIGVGGPDVRLGALPRPSFPAPFTNITELESSFALCAQFERRRDLAASAVAVARYRLRTASLPQQLAEVSLDAAVRPERIAYTVGAAGATLSVEPPPKSTPPRHHRDPWIWTLAP